MYTYTVGYDQEDVSIPEGQMVGGTAIGIIMMGPVWLPWMPGNICNATTFNFPVLYKMMEEVVALEMVVATKPHPQVLEWVIAAGKELEKQGCRAITANCGYFGNYQKKVAAALNVPVFLSPLMQIPIIQCALKPDQKVGVICTNGRILRAAPDLLKNCGVDDLSSVVIGGAEDFPEFDESFNVGVGRVNNVKVEQELVSLAKQMVSKNPEIGALVLECTEMPPYAWAIQKAVRLPVFDYVTMINWVYDAVVRRPFAGFI